MVMTIISRLAFIILLVGLSLPAARADTTSEIQSVIADQLDAFGKDDDTRAYDHASDMIKQLFPSKSIFMEMVRTGYPPVYRAKSWSFAEPITTETGISQIVKLTDEQGRVWNALYTLERDSAGEWKITGCRILKSEGIV
ncbi:MAG: DUF4864 domain-containing protein [Alphaproteobacteria bacterium]